MNGAGGGWLIANCILDYNSGTIVAKLERSEKVLVHDLRFTLCEGESLALIGETGAGKTMTALSIMHLLPGNVTMRNGRVLFCGEEPENMRFLLGTEIVSIPQNGLEYLNPARRVRTQLYDGLKKLGVSRSDLETTALQKLRLAGFEKPEAVIEKFPFQLSGGMAQRVTIALSACSNAKLIIADEPTNGLDDKGKQSFIRLLDEVFPRAAKLIITHDMDAAALCDRVLVLCGGRRMETGTAKSVLSAPQQPYTRALIASLVRNGMHETPTLRAQAGVCPFYSRCPDASERCLARMEHHADTGSEWWCSTQ